MAFATINKGSSYFDTTAYTANGGSQTITNSGSMQPDLIWTKTRSTTSNNILINAIVGASKYLYSNTDGTEVTDANYLISFNSNGFSVGSNNYSNGTTMVAWQWRASNTTAVSNTSGTISSTVSANTTAGFSIVSYTGNGTSGATVGHGLGVAPKMIIVKNRTRVDAWPVDCRAVSGIMYLNETGAKGSYGSVEPFVSTAPTSTVFSLGSAPNTNNSGSSLIAYCFAEVKGYSKFGSYVGNGNADGTFTYTGFRPAFVMAKASSVNGYSWAMSDNKRNPFNQANNTLYANVSDAEYTSLDQFDLLSNGFKLRSIYGNTTGDTYIYMAFAENPFVLTDGTPVTAR